MQLKEKKAKRKVNKLNVAAIVISIIAILGLICLLAGIGVIGFLLKDKPKLDLSDFNSSESTIVYDKNDNQIYELGTIIRQNVEYEDLPNSLIDAFVAVEDARFFNHSGFDIPRFAKAFLSNLKTMSFSQGGSTFTMQLVKNTYFVNDEQGSGAVKSIKRKVQEIALALELENKATKKEIFTNYLNKLNFGGTSQNIRGVQKASHYYFGKNVNELSLPESAMLAGVVNAPYLYNPFNYLEYAQDRRDEVLYLMKYHGYITENEYEAAIATRVEDFLVDSSVSNKGSGNGTPYQAYIDYVVEEVYNVTGLDPYTTPMRIHTTMDKDIQELMDNIQAGNVDDVFEYPNDEFEVASICVDNSNGEILGILGGRNYADGGALLLNHATDQYKQPGSSIKPILDYVQAFEVLGWSTSHIVVDKPLTYQGTDYIISNATNSYGGETSLKYAVGMSLNTPAIQTIRQLIDAKGNSYLVDYLTSMGFDIDLNDFDEQYGIGGKGLQVSCLQLAGAYSALMNGGYYTTPHTVRKIEFLNEKAPISPSYQSKQVISEQACFLMSELLRNDVEGGYANLMGLFRNDDYKVYAKTGTSNWGSEGAQFNIPNGSIKDGWVVACTSDYSIATWMGYEKAQVGKPSYMNYDVYNKNIKGKISKLIIQKTVEKFGTPKDIARPDGIRSITHITKAGTPYVSPIEGMDEKYITTGLIKTDSKYAALSTPQAATISELSEDPKVTLEGTKLSITWPKYPDESMLKVADDTMDISLLKSDGTVLLAAKGTRLFDYTWAFGAIKYKADIMVDGKTIKTITSGEKESSVDLTGDINSKSNLKTCAYYGYENEKVNSTSKCIDVEIKSLKGITIPSNSSLSDVKKIFSSLTDNIIETPQANNDATENQVFKVLINDKEVNIGSEITIDTLAIEKVEIYYYSKVNYSLNISGSRTTDNKIKLVASLTPDDNSATYIWYEGGSQISGETGNEITIEIPDNGSSFEYKVESSNGASNTVTITSDSYNTSN